MDTTTLNSVSGPWFTTRPVTSALWSQHKPSASMFRPGGIHLQQDLNVRMKWRRHPWTDLRDTRGASEMTVFPANIRRYGSRKPLVPWLGSAGHGTATGDPVRIEFAWRRCGVHEEPAVRRDEPTAVVLARQGESFQRGQHRIEAAYTVAREDEQDGPSRSDIPSRRVRSARRANTIPSRSMAAGPFLEA